MTATGARRLLHASTPLCLLIGIFGGWSLLRIVLTAAVPLAIGFEWWRLRFPRGASVAKRVFVFREREAHRPSGAFWLLVGYAAAAWFPFPASATGILVGGIADPVASAVGTRWGGARGRKTWPGTGAVFATGMVIGSALGMPVPSALVAAAVAAALERWSGPLDDNLVLAPGVAAVVWGLSLT